MGTGTRRLCVEPTQCLVHERLQQPSRSRTLLPARAKSESFSQTAICLRTAIGIPCGCANGQFNARHVIYLPCPFPPGPVTIGKTHQTHLQGHDATPGDPELAGLLERNLDAYPAGQSYSQTAAKNLSAVPVAAVIWSSRPAEFVA